MSAVKLLIFVAILFGVYVVWQQGYIDKFLPEEFSHSTQDSFPDISAMIKKGDSRTAAVLAERAFSSPTIKNSELTQVALQLAICTYLNNAKDAEQTCRTIAERFKSANIPNNSPESAIIRFLSVPTITPMNLRDQLANDQLALPGEVAIFVRETYNNGKERNKRAALRNFASLSGDVTVDYWGYAWADRIQIWYDWLFSGKGKSSTLEPLIRMKKSGITYMQETASSSQSTIPAQDDQTKEAAEQTPSFSIEDLTVDRLKEHRTFAAERPAFENFDTNSEKVESYLSTLPDDVAAKEKKRIKQISHLKADLCKMMLKSPYKGTVALKNGESLQGAVMANARGLMVRSKGAPLKKLQWNEISISQFIKLLLHYAALQQTEHKDKAALTYLHIAILCDWYGSYTNAVKYAKKAVSLDSGIKNETVSLMLE